MSTARTGVRPWSVRAFVAGLLAVVLVLGSVCTLLGYRYTYDEWPWSTYPETLHACGRDFVPQGAPVIRSELAAQGYRLVRFGPLQGWLNSGTVWTFDRSHGQLGGELPGGCRVAMWVQGGQDAFQAYTLSGGA